VFNFWGRVCGRVWVAKEKGGKKGKKDPFPPRFLPQVGTKTPFLIWGAVSTLNVGIKAKPPCPQNSMDKKDQVTHHPWNFVGFTPLPLPFPHPFLNTTTSSKIQFRNINYIYIDLSIYLYIYISICPTTLYQTWGKFSGKPAFSSYISPYS
jgi:hypothetical protein